MTITPGGYYAVSTRMLDVASTEEYKKLPVYGRYYNILQ